MTVRALSEWYPDSLVVQGYQAAANAPAPDHAPVYESTGKTDLVQAASLRAGKPINIEMQRVVKKTLT
jgi:hypothetical protein